MDQTQYFPRWVGALLLALTLAGPVQAQDPAQTRARLAAAAATQVGVTVVYDPAYVRLAYPGGDVPLERGVCADVIVRAFRRIGVDLQAEVHEDMKKSFGAYPRNWGLSRPDSNIDHRRVPNLMKFFERQGKKVSMDGPYQPGDIVAWRLPGGYHHIGIVAAERVRGADRHLIVHNIGAGARQEDILYSYTIIGHYRW